MDAGETVAAQSVCADQICANVRTITLPSLAVRANVVYTKHCTISSSVKRASVEQQSQFQYAHVSLPTTGSARIPRTVCFLTTRKNLHSLPRKSPSSWVICTRYLTAAALALGATSIGSKVIIVLLLQDILCLSACLDCLVSRFTSTGSRNVRLTRKGRADRAGAQYADRVIY